MKTPFLSVLAASVAMLTPAQALQIDEPAPKLTELVLNLRDGSKIKATPMNPALAVRAKHGNSLDLEWKKIQQVEFHEGQAEAKFLFEGGDRLSAELTGNGIEVDTSLGRLVVPVAKLQSIDIRLMGGPLGNVALGKPVHGRDGASHGKGLAKHVTDGDPTSHAKPPASSFDYRVDLQDGTDASFGISRIVINWGRFGDEFVGVRQKGGEQWANGAWPGEYVTSYVVECRLTTMDEWVKVHEHKGRPADEKAPGIEIVKRPSEVPGCRSESTTIIDGLHLKHVAELRIRAKGGHWIGLYELEAHGHKE